MSAMSNGGPDRLLSRIAARAARELDHHRRVATAWRVADALLLVPAALGAVGAVVLGVTELTSIAVAAAVAIGAAVLAGTAVLFDLSGRAARAELAATYLTAFLAEAEDPPAIGERAAELKHWFVRIHTAIRLGSDELDLDLLEPPCGPASGQCPPEAGMAGPETSPEQGLPARLFGDVMRGDDGTVRALVVDSGNGGSRASLGRRRDLGSSPREGQQVVKASERAGVRHLHRLRWAFLLAVIFLAVEAVAAFATGSLSLLSDAGHVLADGVGLAMALAAVQLASNSRRKRSRTFGMYRLEIMAALANAALLVAVSGYVMIEGLRRIGDPPDVPGGVLLVVAVAGLVANLVSFWLLKPGASESLNVKAAYLDVAADAVASVGVLVGGLVIHITGWALVDPLVGILIGLWILPRAWQLGREAVRVLVQAAPPHVDVERVESDLSSVPGVAGVHRLHVWTLTSDLEVASAHLIVRPGADPDQVLDEAQFLLQDRYHVAHTTLQIEPDDMACADLDW